MDLRGAIQSKLWKNGVGGDLDSLRVMKPKKKNIGNLLAIPV